MQVIYHAQTYLGPISTSLASLSSVRFCFSDSSTACRGGRNNQRRTSFCSAFRLSQPAAESQRKQWQHSKIHKRRRQSVCGKSWGYKRQIYVSHVFFSQLLCCTQPLRLQSLASSLPTDKLLHTNLSAPRWSTAQWWLTAGGRAWLPSVTLAHSQLHYCRTSLQPWLMQRDKEINPV